MGISWSSWPKQPESNSSDLSKAFKPACATLLPQARQYNPAPQAGFVCQPRRERDARHCRLGVVRITHYLGASVWLKATPA